MSIFATLFAGLGLFLIGARQISTHLREVIGLRIRLLIGRALSGAGAIALLGTLAGLILQSVNAVIHVLVALVSANAIDRNKAFSVIRWANIGTSTLVLVAAIDQHLLALCIMGLAGVAYQRALDQSVKWRHVVGALLGLGLLFLGTDFIKAAAAMIKTAPWLRDEIATYSSWVLPSFLIGAVVAWITQSSTTLVVITMSMAASDLIGYEASMVIVLGAGLGSGFSSYLSAGRMKGTARQLILFQVALRMNGLFWMLLIYGADRWLFDDPLGRGLQALHFTVPHAIVVFYFLVQLVSDLASRAFHPLVLRWLERMAPPSIQETMSKPHYLVDDALAEAETALLLVDKEQLRLVRNLPLYLDVVRSKRDHQGTPPGPGSLSPIQQRQHAERDVLGLCDQFLTELADRHHSRLVLEKSIVMRDRSQLIAQLQESLVELNQLAVQLDKSERTEQLLDGLVQSLHFMLDSLAESVASADSAELDLLRSLTFDRSEIMDKLRKRMQQEPDAAAQQAAFTATTVFERCTWLLRRYVLLIDSQQADSPTHAARLQHGVASGNG